MNKVIAGLCGAAAAVILWGMMILLWLVSI
jgi:hypothetical protein